MQLKAAYIFWFGCIGGSLEIARELLDPSHLVMLSLLRELRIVMSSIMRRRNGVIACSVIGLLLF
jgi:hypothetical protein